MEYDAATGREQALGHLHEAIGRLHQVMAEVEFWSEAVARFAEPVPGYDMQQVTLWLPREQAVALGQTQNERKSKAQQEERSSCKTESRTTSRSPDRAR